MYIYIYMYKYIYIYIHIYINPNARFIVLQQKTKVNLKELVFQGFLFAHKKPKMCKLQCKALIISPKNENS